MNFRIFGPFVILSQISITALPTLAQVPAGWTCPDAYFNNGECDCGCGETDIDCGGQIAPYCVNDRCDSFSFPDWRDNSLCTLEGQDDELPFGWRCSSIAWKDGYCDCGCTAFDQECDSYSATACHPYGDWCPSGEWPGYTDNRQCIPFGEDPSIDSAWSCPSYSYNDGTCHCGCNFLEEDCADYSVHSCEDDFCYDESDAMEIPTYPGYNNNIDCFEPGYDPDLPGWTCLSEYMGDGHNCDCGCGIPDIDCVTDDVAECLGIHCDLRETVVSGNLAQCVEISQDTESSDTETGTADTGQDTTVDTNTVADTGTAPITNTDTGTVIVTDTDSAIVTDSATTVVDTAVVTGTDTGAIPDTGTVTVNDTGTVIVTDTGSDIDTGTLSTVDTTVAKDSSSSNTNTDSQSDALFIEGKPTSYDDGAPTEKKSGSGNLFGCTIHHVNPVQSLLGLLF